MLADTIGVRVGGTAGEQRAVDYAAGELRDLGYEVTVQSVRLPNGRTSHNVVAKKAGAKGPIVVLGGHIDSKSPAPGADDNATGVGTLLELARDFAKTSTPADLRFVAFGTEELIGDGNSDHHHFGSRYYLKSLTSGEKGRFAAMVSIDMIGYGSDFRVRTMGIGTRAVADRLLATAKATKTPLGYLRDPGSTGWSDHEPFERAGLPAAWLEWRDNPNAHTSRDTVGRLVPSKVRTTGELVRAWLVSLTSRDLAALVRTR
jgi:Zn-dependent M28 family amino/carboxypeptidase